MQLRHKDISVPSKFAVVRLRKLPPRAYRPASASASSPIARSEASSTWHISLDEVIAAVDRIEVKRS